MKPTHYLEAMTPEPLIRRPPRRPIARSPWRGGALLLAGLLVLANGCAPPRAIEAPVEPAIPPVPHVAGELEIDVVHPPEGETVPPVDSTFIFGSVGHGDATLTINGAPVEVHPNGAWLAFLPVPRDGRYELVARLGEQVERLVHEVEAAPLPAVDAPPGEPGIVPGTVRPVGEVWIMRGEELEVAMQATPGAAVALALPDGRRVALREAPAVLHQLGFGLDREVVLPGVSDYTGHVRLEEALQPGAAFEIVMGDDTLRVPLEAMVEVLDPDRLPVGVVDTVRPDSTASAQNAPGTDQEWPHFWWNGTRLAIDGRAAGFYRVRLTDDLHAWVREEWVSMEPEGTPLPAGDVGPSITAYPTEEGLELRITVRERLPYRITPSVRGLEIEFYGATGRPAFVGHGPETGFLERLEWGQLTDERFRLHIVLAERLWGYRAHWDDDALAVELRRAPRIDPANPLRNVRIAIDAGHPPGGATGPTRLTEAEANLGVTRLLVPMLRERGAIVLDVRPDEEAVGLFDRVMAVHEWDADLSVSVHFNAFPDGVNPFENQGTHVFYYWPHAVDFARELQRALVAELGLPDRGLRFQNLAMARIWWMPAVLTETLFMMIPEHEAALRDERFRQRIAEAHLEAIRRFLSEVGRQP
jgi:N-acetylmuramoyl-L-alanine amidase